MNSPNQSGFSFRVVFLENENYSDKDHVDIIVDETEDPESDRDEAYSQAMTWAEDNLEAYAADDYEITLVNAF